MDRIRFISTNTAYKDPFGAIKTNQPCTFTLDVAKEEAPGKVQFSYRADGSDNAHYVDMEFFCERDGFLSYRCTVSFDAPDLYFYRFQFLSPDGMRFCGKKDARAYIEDWLDEWQLTVYEETFQTPQWSKGAVMYQIFPDRFRRSECFSPMAAKNERTIHENWFDVPDFIYDNPNYKGNDYFCGNLKGIEERLPYLKELGVDVIYLNPVFESPENHRYSTGDYENIDPYLGTNEDFSALCRACEKLGMRIILDGVFSHTGADSIYFNKYGHYPSVGAYQGADSPYFHWYSFNDSNAGYECWWGFENLPNVNETAPDYLNFITGEGGVLQTWQNRGASGWRLDVADELPDAFLDALRVRVKETDPDSLIIGEVWEDATNKFAYGVRRRYLLGKQLDSVMNYPWRTAVIDYVKHGDGTLFQERVLSILENYPSPVLDALMNILSTHDTERIINVFGVEHEVSHRDAAGYHLTEEEYARGVEKFKAAAFLQFALPGIPSIYYGDEVGLTGFRDPYCRMGYPYGREDLDLLSYFKELGLLRKTYKADFTEPLVGITAEDGVVSFSRGSLLFVINMGKCDRNITICKENVTIFGDKIDKNKENQYRIPAGQYCIMQKK